MIYTYYVRATDEPKPIVFKCRAISDWSAYMKLLDHADAEGFYIEDYDTETEDEPSDHE